MQLNKRILIACLLILLFVSALFITDIFARDKYTAKELWRLGRAASEALSVWQNAKAIVEALQKEFDELVLSQHLFDSYS